MLIANWHDDPRVQSLAEAELNEDDCNLTVVALAAAHLEPLREAVLDRLGVLPTPLRLALAVRLRENTDDPAVRQVLRRYRSEDDESVRTALALSYYDRTATDDTTSIAQLRAELSAVGATMDAVTGAAFAALLAMGRLDVFVQARRGTDSAVPVTVQTGGGFRFNAPLWRKVAAHWGELKEALGANLFVRLEPAGEAAVWACLARVAVRGSDSAKDLYEHLLSIPGDAPLDAVHLQFLERQGAPGARLRDGCLATMARATRANRIDDASLIASEILGRAFAGDEVVLQRLAIPTGADEIHRGLGDLCLPLVSICEGWPDSAELDRIFRCLQERKLTLPPFAACAVIARRSQVSRVVSATRDFCGPFLRHDRRVGVALTGRFFSRRLRDDTEAFEAISDVAEDSKTSTAEAVALLRLLTEARGLTRRLRATCETRATAALGRRSVCPNGTASGRIRAKLRHDPSGSPVTRRVKSRRRSPRPSMLVQPPGSSPSLSSYSRTNVPVPVVESTIAIPLGRQRWSLGDVARRFARAEDAFDCAGGRARLGTRRIGRIARASERYAGSGPGRGYRGVATRERARSAAPEGVALADTFAGWRLGP
jgi:hypothetical protein